MSINTVTSFEAKYKVVNNRIVPEYNKQPLRGTNLNKFEIEFDFQNDYKSI